MLQQSSLYILYRAAAHRLSANLKFAAQPQSCRSCRLLAAAAGAAAPIAGVPRSIIEKQRC